MNKDLAQIVKAFQIPGQIGRIIPNNRGHVNDTFIVECHQNGDKNKYTLQRINQSIFKNPPDLMHNIIRVTEHIRKKLQNDGMEELTRHVLTVVLTQHGEGCCQDSSGSYWRMYQYIDRVESCDYLDSPDQAYQAARAFGRFQRYLADLPEPKLYETIEDFHNTPKRLNDFLEILDRDPHNRAGQAKQEILFVTQHASLCQGLLELVKQGFIPQRVTHNDTKINNVLFDLATHEAICVIDLDTVMPGLSLYDFGDMVRTATCQAAEDERDLSKIQLDITFFEQIALGYARETAGFLTDAEKRHLVFAGKLITLEQMIRFLGDYLNGDVYYKIHRPQHNLDRARTQMKLIQSIIEQEEQMTKLTETIWKRL
jgi:thiamine kinase-like enzyme